jgi:hypothetical protein
MPTTSRFDRQGNLYVLDHNRSRIMIYKGPLGEMTLPVPATPIATATPTASSPPPTPSETPTTGAEFLVWLPSLNR